MLAFEVVKEHQKGDADCQSVAQTVNATAPAKLDYLNASSRCLCVLDKHFDRIANVNEILVFREEIRLDEPSVYTYIGYWRSDRGITSWVWYCT